MEKFYTAKTDRVFKAIFCNEENKHMMINLLSSILEKKITELHFLNNELPITNVCERTKTVDILALVDGEYVHIELNATCSKFLHLRNFIYFSEIYSKKTKRGDEYDFKTKFIHIDFTYGLKANYDVSKYYLMNDLGIKYIDNIEVIEFNMDSLKKYCYNKTSKEYDKFKYLIMLDLNKEELNEVVGDEFMREFKSRIEMLNEDKTFTSAISYEEDQRLTLNTEKRIAFEDGMEKGLQEGLQEGIQKTKINTIKNMFDKNFTLEQIASIAELSVDEIKEILNMIN